MADISLNVLTYSAATEQYQHYLLAQFWSPPTSKKSISLFICLMLHYIHQLVATCVHLPFGF